MVCCTDATGLDDDARAEQHGSAAAAVPRRQRPAPAHSAHTGLATAPCCGAEPAITGQECEPGTEPAA